MVFLIDGFNLYHSIRDVHARTGVNYRWLDIRSLCGSFLPVIGGDAHVSRVFYFSALAHHVEPQNPGAVKRHRAYMRALQSTGVIVELAHFKAKHVRCVCPVCGTKFDLLRHEEKETDVAIACKLLELMYDRSVDSVVLVSGDTDLVPAVRAAMRLATKPIYMLYPVGRRNRAFLGVATHGFRIKEAHYRKYQLPERVHVGKRVITKPSQWR